MPNPTPTLRDWLLRIAQAGAVGNSPRARPESEILQLQLPAPPPAAETGAVPARQIVVSSAVASADHSISAAPAEAVPPMASDPATAPDRAPPRSGAAARRADTAHQVDTELARWLTPPVREPLVGEGSEPIARPIGRGEGRRPVDFSLAMERVAPRAEMPGDLAAGVQSAAATREAPGGGPWGTSFAAAADGRAARGPESIQMPAREAPSAGGFPGFEQPSGGMPSLGELLSDLDRMPLDDFWERRQATLPVGPGAMSRRSTAEQPAVPADSRRDLAELSRRLADLESSSAGP